MHLWILVTLAAAGAHALNVDLSSFGINPPGRSSPVEHVLIKREDEEVKEYSAAPISCTGGMAVDTDGPADGERIPDPDTHSDTTSATYDDGLGSSISAFRVPYVVKPLGSRPGRGRCGSLLTPVRLWDLVRVEYNGIKVMAIVADEGPPGKFGEGSIALHEAVGHPEARQNLGIESGVTYTFYPNTGKRMKSETALLQMLRGAFPPEYVQPPPRPHFPRRHRPRRRDR